MHSIVSAGIFSPRAFRPLPLLTSGWAQTIGAALWPRLPDLRPAARHAVPLPDGDQLVLLENRPRRWQPGNRIVVLVHGLAGSSESKDLVRLSRRLVQSGYLVMRVNLRGCGPGFGLAKQAYHGGRSEDLREVNRWLGVKFPGSPVTQIGISLGGNITLKMAGEDGPILPGELDSIVTVSAPLDLAACAFRLERPGNRFFGRHFASLMVQHAARQQQRFPDLPQIQFPKDPTVRAFDDLCTAPWNGYRDAADYYAQSSSEQFLSGIRCRSLLICSADDPIVDAECYRRLPPSEHIQLVLTSHGGHVGFLARPTKLCRGIRWMDDTILAWLQRLTSC